MTNNDLKDKKKGIFGVVCEHGHQNHYAGTQYVRTLISVFSPFIQQELEREHILRFPA